MNNVLLSHKSDNWRTPTDFYNFIINECHFIDTFPYCSSDDQYEKMYYFTKLFINPPYSHLRTKKFYNYLVSLFNNYNYIVLLVPSRTGSKWFYNIKNLSYKCLFFTYRLKFNDSLGAPFDCCLFIIRRIFSTFDCSFDFIKSHNFEQELFFLKSL